MGFNKKKKQLSKKNRQTKSVLVFDEKARKDYLTGFKKRKDERRKKAQEQVEKMIKEERKNLKQKLKELSQVKTKSQRLHPELEETVEQQVIDLPEHTVTVTNISTVDLAGQSATMLGWNQGRVEDEDEEVPEVSIHKHDRSIRNIKQKIEKTSKHLKQKKSKFKKKKILSKKSRQQKKNSLQNY